MKTIFTLLALIIFANQGVFATEQLASAGKCSAVSNSAPKANLPNSTSSGGNSVVTNK